MTEFDWRASTGRSLEAQVLIVGAGPAGLTVARRLARAGTSVLLVDSGGRAPDPDADQLNTGTTSGDAYNGLETTRHRRLGGTTAIWNTPVAGRLGAKYLPLDPADFSTEAGVHSGWPIRYQEIVPYYHEAQEYCQLAAFRYQGTEWLDPAQLLANDPTGLVTRVYQLGPRTAWTGTAVEEISASETAVAAAGLTVTGLTFGAGGRRVIGATAVDPTGQVVRLEAATVILAGGAIENVRLLLGTSLGAALPWLGRGFMEHPRDKSLVAIPTSAEVWRRAVGYDVAPAAPVIGRLALGDALPGRADWSNASVSLFPRWKPGFVATLRGRRGTTGYGWSETQRPDRAFDRFQLLINVEQFPHWENRITLGADRDRFGIPRPHLHWAWRSDDAIRLGRVHALVHEAIEAAGWARVATVSVGPPDPNAHHHAGTTRMANDPSDGVVDRDGLVFGAENLYVAGASVFPRAGFANPTLSIVALAIRLADHLIARRAT